MTDGEAHGDFCAQVARAHARGETISTIIVRPGETAEEVLEREGIAADMPCIVRTIVEPEHRLRMGSTLYWRLVTDYHRIKHWVIAQSVRVGRMVLPHS